MNRAEMLRAARTREAVWDFIVIGGGAIGIGCCLDAASRGFSVLLLEQNDFGKGTSSRSTKLIHGGVRYLAQANFSLVKESLRERAALLKNAAHLVAKQSFIVPCYSLREKFFYAAGLKFYSLLAGEHGFGKSKILSQNETAERLPNVRRDKLRGGVLYFDGQFDDARLLIDLAKTAVQHGAVILNYAPVCALTKSESKIDGVKFRDAETGEEFTAKARIVINATGAFCDSVRGMSSEKNKNLIAPSQGVHLVFDRKFFASDDALMIPKTNDGRVLFAIPWHGKIVVGTTDTPIEKAELEPRAFEKEIKFILQTLKNYLSNAPERADVLSVFAGIRPLVESGKSKNTAAVSRDHIIEIDDRNLLTVTGGKWTTYRRMAEDAINQAIERTDLPPRKCATENLKIHGADAAERQKLMNENQSLAEKLHRDFSYRAADIVWAARFEMARTLEDVLARRTRVLFLDAPAAIKIAPRAAEIMRRELGENEIWAQRQTQNFSETARRYLCESEPPA